MVAEKVIRWKGQLSGNSNFKDKRGLPLLYRVKIALGYSEKILGHRIAREHS